MSEDTPKMRKKCEKLRKISPTWPQDPPKREGIKNPTAYALPCLAPNLESKKTSHYLGVLFNTQRGGTPAHLIASRMPPGRD